MAETNVMMDRDDLKTFFTNILGVQRDEEAEKALSKLGIKKDQTHIPVEVLGVGEKSFEIKVGEFGAQLLVFTGPRFGRLGFLNNEDDGIWFSLPNVLPTEQDELQYEFAGWAYRNNDSLYELIDPPMTEEDEETEFTQGSEELLNKIVELIILSDSTLSTDEPQYLYINGILTNDPDSKMRWGASWTVDDFTKSALEKLLQFVQFEGVEWAYNDGRYNSRSGYDPYGPCFTFETADILAEASSRERLEARTTLRRWLDQEIALP